VEVNVETGKEAKGGGRNKGEREKRDWERDRLSNDYELIGDSLLCLRMKRVVEKRGGY